MVRPRFQWLARRFGLAACLVVATGVFAIGAAPPAGAVVTHCTSTFHQLNGSNTVNQSSSGEALERTCGPCDYELKTEYTSDGLSNDLTSLGTFVKGSTKDGCEVCIEIDIYNWNTGNFAGPGKCYTSGDGNWIYSHSIGDLTNKTGWTWQDESLSVSYDGYNPIGVVWGFLPSDTRMCTPAKGAGIMCGMYENTANNGKG